MIRWKQCTEMLHWLQTGQPFCEVGFGSNRVTPGAFDISRLGTKHVDALIGSSGFGRRARGGRRNRTKVDQHQPRADVSNELELRKREGNKSVGFGWRKSRPSKLIRRSGHGGYVGVSSRSTSAGQSTGFRSSKA
jgi:hypothetical protein